MGKRYVRDLVTLHDLPRALERPVAVADKHRDAAGIFEGLPVVLATVDCNDVQLAVTVDVADCDRLGRSRRRERLPGLERAVSVPQRDDHASLLSLRNESSFGP